MKPITYSIVIPVYGTALSLAKIAARIKTVFENEIGKNYELIFVNDCSPNPDTNNILLELQKTDGCVKVLLFTKNYGQQAATLCGLQYSTGEYVITMDDDLQHAPEDIPHLIAQQQHDVVFATFPQKKHSLKKKIFSRVKGYCDHILLGKPKHIYLSSFRLINRVIVDAMMKIKTPYPFIPAQIFSITHDIVNVQVEHHDRYDGQTTYTFFLMLKLFSNLIINNSSFLLSLLGRLGLIAALTSFLAGGYLACRALFFGNAIQGWTSLAVLILLFGGLLLFAVGVIGEYLIRIVNTMEGKPSYVVKKKLGFKEEV